MLNRDMHLKEIDTLNKGLNEIFCNLSKNLCPDENIRIYFKVGVHFVERLIERFNKNERIFFINSIKRWIDKEYCMLLYELNISSNPLHSKIKLDSGTFCIVFNNRRILFRTCYK